MAKKRAQKTHPMMFRHDGKSYLVMPPQIYDTPPYIRFDMYVDIEVPITVAGRVTLDKIPGYEALHQELVARGFKRDIEGLQIDVPTNSLRFSYNAPPPPADVQQEFDGALQKLEAMKMPPLPPQGRGR